MDRLHTTTKIIEFLQRHTIAVIATTNDEGLPEAAAIDVSVRANFEIVFDTLKDTRKYSNISRNGNVALVIGWDDNITVQCEGLAVAVPEADVASYQRDHIDKVPAERLFIERGAIIFKILPRWVRYSDFTKEPNEILEMRFEPAISSSPGP